MSQRLKFFIVDVFGESRYSGNPLAVFLNASSLADDEMQRIAREINFSETTFILSDKEKSGGYDVRIFTPAAEIDFAGHPTLGTASIIREHILGRAVEEIVLDLKVGQVPVHFTSDGTLWMRQVPAVFGEVIHSQRVAPVLSIPEDNIDANLPVEEVSTGLPCIIVAVKSMAGLKRIRIDRDRYETLIAETWAKVLLVFCPQGYGEGQSLGVRVFPVALGIAEDPATGSGNGCLAASLVKHRYFGTDAVDIRIGQGYEIGRPSVVHIRSQRKKDQYTIEVGGRVMPVAEGLWG
jgi:trans-2,3-dihydro-3-hydroxyanthranilate isomerase